MFRSNKVPVNPSLAVASEGFFDSEGFYRLTRGLCYGEPQWRFGMERMDADLPESQIAPPPDPSPFGRTASATGPFCTHLPVPAADAGFVFLSVILMY